MSLCTLRRFSMRHCLLDRISSCPVLSPLSPPSHLDQTSDHTCVLVEIWVPMTKNPQTGLPPVIIHHMRALFWTGQLVGGQDLKEIAGCPNHCWSIFQVKKDPCGLFFAQKVSFDGNINWEHVIHAKQFIGL